jgi:signal transduction histidine kinase
LLRFQTALQLWPSDEGRKVLEKAIDQTSAAVTEGRDAVQGLRLSATESNDLAQAIRAFGQTLGAEYGPKKVIDLYVEVLGSPRALHPILRDEVFRIAGEALRNAFRHSGASHVEVETRYDERELRLRVRDDGKGMDPEVLAHGGREGHFGLHGMRERAKVIGGKLAVWSGDGMGTEVELRIPARQAYALQAPADLAI